MNEYDYNSDFGETENMIEKLNLPKDIMTRSDDIFREYLNKITEDERRREVKMSNVENDLLNQIRTKLDEPEICDKDRLEILKLYFEFHKLTVHDYETVKKTNTERLKCVLGACGLAVLSASIWVIEAIVKDNNKRDIEIQKIKSKTPIWRRK